jgi:hypothetical protein
MLSIVCARIEPLPLLDHRAGLFQGGEPLPIVGPPC